MHRQHSLPAGPWMKIENQLACVITDEWESLTQTSIHGMQRFASNLNGQTTPEIKPYMELNTNVVNLLVSAIMFWTVQGPRGRLPISEMNRDREISSMFWNNPWKFHSYKRSEICQPRERPASSICPIEAKRFLVSGCLLVLSSCPMCFHRHPMGNYRFAIGQFS